MHGDGDEDAGLADVLVVEEVFGAGLEGVGVEEPAVEGDLNAELMFFVAFSFEWDVAEAVVVGVVEQRTGDAGDCWWLVEVAVEGAEDPVEFGDLEGYSDAWVERVFGDGTGEVRLSQATDEGEPRRGLVVVGDEGLLHAGGDDGVDGVDAGDAEEVAFVLGVAVDAGRDGIVGDDGGDAGLQAGVEAGFVGGGGSGRVVRVGLIVGLIEVEEGADLRGGLGVEGVQPGEGGVAVGFVFAVAEAAGVVEGVFPAVGIGVVGDLVVVGAELADEAVLVGGVVVVDDGAEAAVAVFGVVDGLRDGGLEAVVAAVAVEAGVPG